MPDDRRVYFDLYCTASDGKQFIIEVQLAPQANFLERAIYYSSVPIVSSVKRGGRGKDVWHYNIASVFFLGLNNFDFRRLPGQAPTERDDFVHCFDLRNTRTGAWMTNGPRFAFLEVARFDKPLEDCEGFIDKFLFLMKNIATFTEAPAQLRTDPYFGTVLMEAEYARMNKKQKAKYRKNMQRIWDYQNTIDFAREQGLREGVAEGRVGEKLSTARRMLAKGISVDAIVELTELTEDQIREIVAADQQSESVSS